MTDEEKRDVGQRIKDFLKSEDYNQADAAREFCHQIGVTFEAAQTKISRIVNGDFESNQDFFVYLYETFQANIGFLLTGSGPPRVKSVK